MNKNEYNTMYRNSNNNKNDDVHLSGGSGVDEFEKNNFITNNNNNQTEDDDDDYEPCTKKIMPCLFAWFLLVSTSAAYFTLVLPMYIEILGNSNFYYFVLLVASHSLLLFYVVLNFTIATFMDPGRFPKVDISEGVEPNDVIANVQTTSYKNVLINDINVRMKWCTTCQFYRPPRSSHCGVCNACIDTMDHHCPWVCNCIARRNYKYFLQFLISLTLHMIVIFALSLTLVLLNKENLTHLPIVISIFLIILVTILIIPIGGLTGFHVILVSRGRTTNEQVTGKFRTGVNPFDMGCLSNWSQTCFSSIPPSYVKFRRKRQKEKEYFQTKLLLKMPAYYQHQNSLNSKIIYHKRDKLNPYDRNSIKIMKNESVGYPLMPPVATAAVASSTTTSSSTNGGSIMVTGGKPVSSSSTSSSSSGKQHQKKILQQSNNHNNIDRKQMHKQNELELKYNNYLMNNDDFNQANNGGPIAAPTSTRSTKYHTNSNVKHTCGADAATNRYENNNIADEINENSVWLDRKKVKPHRRPADGAQAAPSRAARSTTAASKQSSKSSIDKIMLEEKRLQQLKEKERLISSSRNTDEERYSSSNSSSRYIRNNSYLNANPLNMNINGNHNHNHTGASQPIPTTAIYDLRPSSSISNNSNGYLIDSRQQIVNNGTNGVPKKTKPTSNGPRRAAENGKHNMTKINNINNNHHETDHFINTNGKANKKSQQQQQSNDYGSYEITV